MILAAEISTWWLHLWYRLMNNVLCAVRTLCQEIISVKVKFQAEEEEIVNLTVLHIT
jgi:hypothetical protein